MKTATPCIDGYPGEYLEVWKAARGEVPMEPHGPEDIPTKRMSLHHLCRHGNCVNLRHIVAVTGREHALLHSHMRPDA